MATPTFDLLGSVTLTANTRTVTFSGISQAYRDLVLVLKVATSGNSETPCITFNGVTNSYYVRTIEGNGSSVENGLQDNNSKLQLSAANYSVNTTPATYVADIFDYSVSRYKQVLSSGGGSNMRSCMVYGWWQNTAAINSISIFTDSSLNRWAVGSTFKIYGVAA